MTNRQSLNYFIRLIGFIPLLPLIIFQAKKVKANTLRLPIADGKQVSNTPNASLNILHIGESTVAGVGVNKLEQGLTKSIIDRLNQVHTGSINWHILAENGATLSQLNQLSSDLINPDILLITVGVNDTTKFTSTKNWRMQLKQCVDKFSGPNSQVFFTQVPDMALFPALPFPLNRFIGLRSQLLDLCLKKLCLSSNWTFIEASLPIQPKWMAIDGYHPNQAGYQVWAEQISHSILEALKIKPKL